MGVRLVVHNFIVDEMDYTGTHNHDDLLHRDLADQHPIYAITGLQEVLNTIETNILNISTTILEKEAACNQYTDSRISSLSTTINSRIDGLNILNDVIDTYGIDLTYNFTTKKLKADVIVYNDPDDTNSLVLTSDGLYVPKLITKDTDTITWDSTSEGESLEEIFLNGIKFSHYKTNNNLYRPSDANAWRWDSTLNSFIQPENTDTYNGFITKDFYDKYKHTVRLISTNNDDDLNGIILGFVFDENGYPQTLSALIQKGVDFGNYTFAIYYNYYLPEQTLIANYNLTNTTGGWSGDHITLYATKSKNLLTVSATSWNYDNQLDNITDAADLPFEHTFEIDLNDYSFGRFFKDKVRYGYSNQSQPYSYFDHVFFYSKDQRSSQDVFANVKIVENENNAIETSSDGLFVQKFLISQEPENALKQLEDGYFVKDIAMFVSNTRLNGLIHEGDSYYYVHKSHSFITVEQEYHEFIVGDFIYYDYRTDKYQKASAIDSFDINIVGMVSYVQDESNFEYVCSGFVETDLFNTEHQYVQGMPLYISDTEPGKVTQQQPDISKAVGYPVAEIGVIISIERGIQYGQEANIGDFKTSANDYNIRSDGFIKIKDNIEYKLSLVQKLVNTLDYDFLSTYTIVDYTNNRFQFKNSEQLYEYEGVVTGLNLFIKAF